MIVREEAEAKDPSLNWRDWREVKLDRSTSIISGKLFESKMRDWTLRGIESQSEDAMKSDEGMNWTVNERTTVSIAVPFTASIVTDWADTDLEGIPEMTPVDESIDNPIGRDPDEIVNERPSPLIEGMIENDSFFVKTYDDWG